MPGEYGRWTAPLPVDPAQSRRAVPPPSTAKEAPGRTVPVQLYWHCWNLESAVLDQLTTALTAAAAQALAAAAPDRLVYPVEANEIFLRVSGEETGLLGSANFVAHPTLPLPSYARVTSAANRPSP